MNDDCVTDAEGFVRLAVRRSLIVTFGKADPSPELGWSAPLNSAEFIFRLQCIRGDRWGDHDVEPYWRHLHCGHERSN